MFLTTRTCTSLKFEVREGDMRATGFEPEFFVEWSKHKLA